MDARPPSARTAICLRCFTLLEPQERCDRCAETAISLDDVKGRESYQAAARSLLTKRRRFGRLEWFGLGAASYGVGDSIFELLRHGFSPFELEWLVGSLVVGAGVGVLRWWRRRRLLAGRPVRSVREQEGILAGERKIRSPLGKTDCLAFSAMILTGDSRMVVARDAACAEARVVMDSGEVIPVPPGRVWLDPPLPQFPARIGSAEGTLSVAFQLARELVTETPIGLERCLQPGHRVALELQQVDPYRTEPGRRVPRLRMIPAA
jgi:hypothetical protein